MCNVMFMGCLGVVWLYAVCRAYWERIPSISTLLYCGEKAEWYIGIGIEIIDIVVSLCYFIDNTNSYMFH